MEYPASIHGYKALRAGGFLVLSGLMLVFLAAWHEQVLIAEHPLRALLIAVEAPDVPEGAFPVSARPVAESNLSADMRQLLERLRAQPGQDELVELAGLTRMERVLMVDASCGLFVPAFVSGRLPEPGQPEVLAGALARFDAFEMDGVEFKVTGRLDPLIPGVLTSYFLPAHETFGAMFASKEDVTRGWLDAQGQDRIEKSDIEESSGGAAACFLLPFGRLPGRITTETMLGLMLVAAGGAMVQVYVLRQLAGRAGGVFRPFLSELTTRPRLLFALHLALYGALFAAMTGGYLHPRITWNAVRFTRDVFAEGELGYIGRAYESGNILMATLATLKQNYVMGTCFYTVLPSLIIPFAGVFKNLLSFSFVGLVMAPLWTGTAAQNTYHSITLTLELEAYVLASFAVCVLPLRVFEGFQGGAWATQYVTGLRVIAGAVVVVGVMLALAAAYEATTLILLN
ncbi:MAG TPA: hypothetical protein PK166_02270 [Candidatus Hydrogenedentes bacterium]|nr:hypothetical protein [Candidatus Hydrogenedentota bacterium]